MASYIIQDDNGNCVTSKIADFGQARDIANVRRADELAAVERHNELIAKTGRGKTLRPRHFHVVKLETVYVTSKLSDVLVEYDAAENLQRLINDDPFKEVSPADLKGPVTAENLAPSLRAQVFDTSGTDEMGDD